MSSTISAIARGTEGMALREFARANKLAEDWGNCRESSIMAWHTGKSLDNRNGNDERVNGGINEELLIHLEGCNGRVTLNLATVLAMATAYSQEEWDRVHKLLKER